MLVPEAEPETPAASPFEAPFEEWQIDVQKARLAIITPLLATRKGSRDRGAKLREAAGKLHDYPGGPRSFDFDTLRVWVGDFERDGFLGLMPQKRSDCGTRRVPVSREWDAAIDLPEDDRKAISKRIVREGQSMVSNDGTSNREVIRLCGIYLARYCAEAGSLLPKPQLQAICKLNQKWAAGAGLDAFRLVHMHDKDHKAWQDKAVPRIRRELHERPMGLLIGDVHYVDILVAEGKEPVRVRLIAWMDAASLFAWVTPVFLSKGQGIRQEDVAEALSQVAFCPHGGIPQEYYLDNGSEYTEIADAMVRLSNLAEMEFRVTLAKPYSPTSKGDIEGFFNILEGIFKPLPGWIGGDRTNKKCANKGQVVQPYTRGLAALEDDIRAAVAIYNDRPQSGRLRGLSPLQALERKIARTGFAARVPSEEAFDLIFSKPDSRTIRQGMIRFENTQWHTPDIDGLPNGESVDILVPLRKHRERIFVRHGGKDLGWAEPGRVFEHGDRDGARRQSRLEKGRVDAVRRLKSQVDPDVSTFDMQKAAVERIAPAVPAPELWATSAIDKTSPALSAAEREAAEDAATRELMQEFLAASGKVKGERTAAATAGLSRAT